MKNKTLSYFRFTPNAVNVAKLIIRDNSSKEICDFFNLPKRTIKNNDRIKLTEEFFGIFMKQRQYLLFLLVYESGLQTALQ